MVIHPESHLDRVGGYLRDLRVLEVGCGDGFRSKQLSAFCRELVGMDPNPAALRDASELHCGQNIEYCLGSAEALPFDEGSFQAVIFVLSLHHVPEQQMSTAIDEAVRVAAEDAPIIFIEPGFRGSFFDLDASVGACDGDERLVKAQAYAAILAHPGLEEIEQFWDMTCYSLESTQDFMDEFELPQDRYQAIDRFLTGTGHRLEGERRINVCRPRS